MAADGISASSAARDANASAFSVVVEATLSRMEVTESDHRLARAWARSMADAKGVTSAESERYVGLIGLRHADMMTFC